MPIIKKNHCRRSGFSFIFLRANIQRYADRETVFGMAKSAAQLLEKSPFQRVDIATAADSNRVFIMEKERCRPDPEKNS